MNVRKRTLPATTGSAPKNSMTNRRDAASQVQPIRNAHNKPKPTGYGKVKNAVNG